MTGSLSGSAASAYDLKVAATRALAAGDFLGAETLLQRSLSIESKDVSAWLNLAAARRATGELARALDATEKALVVEPRNFMALLMKASLLEGQGKARAAANAYGVALTQAPPNDRLDAATRNAVRRATETNQRHVAEFDAFLRSKVMGGASGREARQAEAFIDYTLRRRRRYTQQPAEFFYPGLPAIEFYEREEFPFLRKLEAATPAMQRELRAVLEEPSGMTPYIHYPPGVPLDQWVELNHNPDWSAFHLIEHGRAIEPNAHRCPETMAAIAELPQPRLNNRSPASMFSVLKPHTRIPPHTGVANTRLVLHLPLIVPDGCAFRVGNEVRPWRIGEAWVFDDTIEHEAWNDSDKVRVILICDIWSPRLSEGERDMISAVMAAMDEFNGGDESDT